MTDLQAELLLRKSMGNKPTTVKNIEQVLASLGYRLDRTMDCRGVTRHLTGPRAGSGYPAITTGIREKDTGKSFAHFEARRDSQFQALQKLRYEESLFAVVKGAILEI